MSLEQQLEKAVEAIVALTAALNANAAPVAQPAVAVAPSNTAKVATTAEVTKPAKPAAKTETAKSETAPPAAKAEAPAADANTVDPTDYATVANVLMAVVKRPGCGRPVGVKLLEPWGIDVLTPLKGKPEELKKVYEIFTDEAQIAAAMAAVKA